MAGFLIRTTRPWGSMVTLIHTRRFWLKLIRVRGRTSLQSHARRSEVHIGSCGVRYVPPRAVHRMERGAYVEFAFGQPREEDIERYEDDYGRA